MAETRVAPTNADATTSDAVDAPSIYWKLCGVPMPTPLLLRDAYGFQWLHFGADLSDEGDIVEQLKADYTQIGTMAAVMIIFSTNMLLARNKLDVRSDLYGRNQIMGFYTLAWILADVSFLNCAFDCVVLKLALNTCPDDMSAARFADRFGDLCNTPIMMLFVACLCVIAGFALYIYVTLGRAFRWATLVLFGFVAIPFHAFWYHTLLDALYVSIETRRRRTSASERREKRGARAGRAPLDLAPDAIRGAWAQYLTLDGSVEPDEFLDYLSRKHGALELTWATDRVSRAVVEMYCQKLAWGVLLVEPES